MIDQAIKTAGFRSGMQKAAAIPAARIDAIRRSGVLAKRLETRLEGVNSKLLQTKAGTPERTALSKQRSFWGGVHGKAVSDPGKRQLRDAGVNTDVKGSVMKAKQEQANRISNAGTQVRKGVPPLPPQAPGEATGIVPPPSGARPEGTVTRVFRSTTDKTVAGPHRKAAFVLRSMRG